MAEFTVALLVVALVVAGCAPPPPPAHIGTAQMCDDLTTDDMDIDCADVFHEYRL